MTHIERTLLLGLMAGGLLGGCSDQEPSTLPEEPEVAAGPADHAFGKGRLITFDGPGAIGTFALDINNAGVIVGRYRTEDGVVHGFLRRRGGGIVTIDFPGSIFTVAAGINNRGDIVGQYTVPRDPDIRHGYLLQDGKFITIDPPGSVFTNALGINGRGDVTGRFEDGDGVLHGFRLRRGTFKTFDVPNAVETHMFRSNNSGTIVGGYVDAHDRPRLFTAYAGKFKTLPIPGAKPVSMDQGDINADGDIVGAYCDGEPPCTLDTHGLLLTDHGRHFTRIDVPHAAGTSTFGLNDHGDIVGGFVDADGVGHGFLMPR